MSHQVVVTNPIIEETVRKKDKYHNLQTSEDDTNDLSPEKESPGPIEIESDTTSWNSKVGLYVRGLSAIAALNSSNLGYIMGVNAGVADSFQREDSSGWYLDDTELEMFMGMLSFTALLGSAAMGSISDIYGRRATFLSSSTTFIIGLSIMVVAPSYGMLMFGRAITGFGIGLGLAIDPMYISEISPPELRGFLVSCSEVAINFGILLGYVAAFALRNVAGNVQWRVMLAVGIPMPMLLVGLVVFVLPESPRWLLTHGRREEGSYILSRLTGQDGDVLADEIQEDMEREQQEAAGVTWTAMFCEDRSMQRKLVAGVGVALAQQITAEEPIISYMISIFEDAGITSTSQQFGALVLVGIAKVLAIVVAGYLFDIFGRKPLLIYSNIGIAVSLFLLAGASGNAPPAAFGAMVLYVVAFSCGMGPGAWLIPTEVFTNDIRAKGMSVCTVANRTAALILTSSFLTIRNVMTDPGCYIFFGVIGLLNALFIHKCVPETKGLRLEDVAQLFEDKPRRDDKELI